MVWTIDDVVSGIIDLIFYLPDKAFEFVFGLPFYWAIVIIIAWKLWQKYAPDLDWIPESEKIDIMWKKYLAEEDVEEEVEEVEKDKHVDPHYLYSWLGKYHLRIMSALIGLTVLLFALGIVFDVGGESWFANYILTPTCCLAWIFVWYAIVDKPIEQNQLVLEEE